MTTRMFDSDASEEANLLTRSFKISGVMGSFCVLCANMRFAPATVSLTIAQRVGSCIRATWWAQDNAFTASSTGALVEDF